MREEDQAPGDPDPRVLGARLQEARKARRITQQQAAEALDLSRPTYIAIEKGTRPVQPGELIRLAELYGRGLHELLRQRPPVRDFVPHFRAAAGDAAAAGDELEQAIAEMERLCDDYLELEQICQSSLPRHYPPPYEVGGQDLQGAAEWVARQERNRLGLGDTPVPHLRELLETDVGLRIWYLSLPNRVSGLFVYTEELGGCIGVQRKHPPGRQLWSLAHEYAHFLGHRYQVEVTGFADSLRKSPKERFADGFAGEFLLPAPGLKRRFHDLLRSSGRITPAMLVELSSLYGVSFQALVLRLEGLRLLPVGTWDGLAEKRFQVEEAQQLLGIEPARREPLLPRRYVRLAVQAYEGAEISEGQLAEYLRTDRVAAREVVQGVLSQAEVSSCGEPGQLSLDFEQLLPGVGDKSHIVGASQHSTQ